MLTLDLFRSADFNLTKFTVTLNKKSPVVIVLSQLDDRYFKGFEGQYSFQLHFRLDKEGEEDYIVRSHGNYSMRRSVSADLELDPGTYPVLMRITARRFSRDATPEKRIRDFCKTRPNKLIQIGLSYDLAHAKGEIIETEEEKERRLKLEERKKASMMEKKKGEVSLRKRREWEFGKRMRARDKRHAKKREEHQKRKVEKQNASDPSDDGDQVRSTDGATVASGVEGEVEKRAAAGASGDTGSDGIQADDTSIPTPPADAKAEKPIVDGATKGITGSTEKPSIGNTEPEKDVQEVTRDVPVVTVNDDPPPQAQPGSDLAPPSGTASVNDANDDYQYDSDASFLSSVDSVLDLPEDCPPVGATAEDARQDESDDSDAEFNNDPWNAVCVVGLRVYSKDEACSIRVVRPRSEAGEEEAGLEVDDVSKGVSEEKEERKRAEGGDAKEEKGGQQDEVQDEVKVGIEE